MNTEARRFILDSLSDKYNLNMVREGIHLSSLIYCLTKSYLDTKQTMRCTDDEVLLFTTGFALEAVLIPNLPIVTSPTYEVDGIFYRPDFVVLDYEGSGAQPSQLCEIKSTRKGMKKHMEELPEKWLTYQKAGCHMMNTNEYNLYTLLVAERPKPDLVCETIIYTAEEIEENWEYIITRRNVYRDALEQQKLPEPREHCDPWECGMCRYQLVCDTLQGQGGMRCQ